MNSYVKCRVTAGLHPQTRTAVLRTADGKRIEVPTSKSAVRRNRLRVGEVGRRDGRVLVEFPGEAANGDRRAWVSEDRVEVRSV